jgi:polyhydroxyalkanoate synthesis regulator phasin
MNPDTLVQLVQKGFRVTVGATASLIETLQDPQRREENLYRLRTELSQLTEEWEAKGEITEQDARSFVENVLRQQSDRSSQPSSASGTTVVTTATPTASPDVQQDLRDLTEQIAAIRSELERLRVQDS